MKPTFFLAIFLALIVIIQASPVNLNKREESSETPKEGDPAESDRTVPTGPNPLHNKK